MVDLREELRNVPDSVDINSESVSNEIDEHDLQDEKHSEHGI
jgi:hypothetical protein